MEIAMNLIGYAMVVILVILIGSWLEFTPEGTLFTLIVTSTTWLVLIIGVSDE